MPADDVARVRLDLSELERRVRRVEDREDPTGQRLVQEFHALQAKVVEMDLQGTTVTKLHLQSLQMEMTRIWKALEEKEQDRKTLRRAVWMAILISALSLIGGLILLAINILLRGSG